MARAARRRAVPLLGDLPKRVDRAQARVEKTFRRAWKATLDALPVRTRRAVKDLTRRVEKTSADLDRRRKRTMKTVEKRSKKLMSEVEHRATEAGKNVVERLDIASRHELERLSRRVAQLERKARPRPARKAATKVAA